MGSGFPEVMMVSEKHKKLVKWWLSGVIEGSGQIFTFFALALLSFGFLFWPLLAGGYVQQGIVFFQDPVPPAQRAMNVQIFWLLVVGYLCMGFSSVLENVQRANNE